MGFLDNTTNNIILDAVLTDVGRQFLARNDGSFSIHKFAMSDDEIDYGIIEKYGRTVGKEKITKNSPILEALTNQTQAQKYKLISVSNPYLTYLPTLSLSGDSNVNSTTNIVTLGRNSQKTSQVTLEQVAGSGESSIDVELRDQTFVVKISNMFLQILKTTPEIDETNTATYVLTRQQNENSYGGSILQFTLSAKTISDTYFTIYGTTANKNIIATYVTVTGLQSGAVKEFRVNIDKTL